MFTGHLYKKTKTKPKNKTKTKQNKKKPDINKWISKLPGSLWNPLSKAVFGKFHGSCGHRKSNHLHYRANFENVVILRHWDTMALLGFIVLRCYFKVIRKCRRATGYDVDRLVWQNICISWNIQAETANICTKRVSGAWQLSTTTNWLWGLCCKMQEVFLVTDKKQVRG